MLSTNIDAFFSELDTFESVLRKLSDSWEGDECESLVDSLLYLSGELIEIIGLEGTIKKEPEMLDPQLLK